jgi:hypothetical protein
VPAGLGLPERWKEGVTWVIQNLLPPALRRAKAIILPSSSTGFLGPETLSFRAFWLLDASVELVTMKAWLLSAKRQGFALDDCLAQAGQPNYIARAQFIGMKDPLIAAGGNERVFIIDGDEYAHIDWREYEAFDAQYAAEMRKISTTITNNGGGWEAQLEATLGGVDSYNQPLKRAAFMACASDMDDDSFVTLVSPIVAKAIERNLAAALGAAQSISDDRQRSLAIAAAHKDAAARRQLYRDGELYRLHRNYTKRENKSRAELQKTLSILGLE